MHSKLQYVTFHLAQFVVLSQRKVYVLIDSSEGIDGFVEGSGARQYVSDLPMLDRLVMNYRVGPKLPMQQVLDPTCSV